MGYFLHFACSGVGKKVSFLNENHSPDTGPHSLGKKSSAFVSVPVAAGIKSLDLVI